MSNKICVEEIVTLVSNLGELLAQETILLREMKIKHIGEMQKEKMKLTLAIEKMIQKVKQDRRLLGQMIEEDRIKLRETIKLFQEILSLNEKRLSVAIEVNRRVVDTIKESVTLDNGKFTYNGNADSKDSKSVLSISLNQTV